MSPSISEVLGEARLAGLTITPDGVGGLSITGPKNAITPDLTARLRECKADLVAYLSDPAALLVPDFLRDIDEGEIAKAYETKATIPGQMPPFQRVKALEAWLASIDWRYGLRCGKTGEQCVVCKGLPCINSIEWPHPGEKKDTS
jgi:hypothetical protein